MRVATDRLLTGMERHARAQERVGSIPTPGTKESHRSAAPLITFPDLPLCHSLIRTSPILSVGRLVRLVTATTMTVHLNHFPLDPCSVTGFIHFTPPMLTEIQVRPWSGAAPCQCGTLAVDSWLS